MAESFERWESDPLFSAAEVVQDSADRTETVYRLLLHEQYLLEGNSSDAKLYTSVQFHRRDLMTALETTKWQLEDFERAVHFAAVSDKSNLRAYAISRFKQFIKAIREQIIQVEKNLESMHFGDLNRNTQPINFIEHDTDGLARFLSGGESEDSHKHCNPDSNIMSRFLDSAAHSDEIVELEPTDVGDLEIKNKKHMDHVDSSKENQLNIVSQYPKMTSHASDFQHVYLREREDEGPIDNLRANDLEVGASNTKCFSARNGSRVSLFRPLCNFWFSNINKLTRSFTKRRKDGDITYEFMSDNDQSLSNSLKILPADQVVTWIDAIKRRSQHHIRPSLLPLQLRVASIVFITLVLIGVFVYRIA